MQRQVTGTLCPIKTLGDLTFSDSQYSVSNRWQTGRMWVSGGPARSGLRDRSPGLDVTARPRSLPFLPVTWLKGEVNGAVKSLITHTPSLPPPAYRGCSWVSARRPVGRALALRPIPASEPPLGAVSGYLQNDY